MSPFCEASYLNISPISHNLDHEPRDDLGQKNDLKRCETLKVWRHWLLQFVKGVLVGFISWCVCRTDPTQFWWVLNKKTSDCRASRSKYIYSLVLQQCYDKRRHSWAPKFILYIDENVIHGTVPVSLYLSLSTGNIHPEISSRVSFHVVEVVQQCLFN